MKITVITPSFNSAATIEDTIRSVREQRHTDIEYIVLDGGSTDGTQEIVARHMRDFPITLVSEPDNGLYDAMNKGILRATGDVVGILNSDDFYTSKDTLSAVAQAFDSQSDAGIAYGDLQYVSQADTSRKTRFWKAGEYDERKLDNGWMIPHPTFFARRSVYVHEERLFNTDLSLAADYELMLRLLKIRKVKAAYIPETLVTMREGGASASSIAQRLRGWKELRKAWEINSLRIPRFFILRRVACKISQFVKKTK